MSVHGISVPNTSDREDDAYDLYVARVDAGEQCPVCKHLQRSVMRTEAFGIPLFHCEWCSAEWFDLVTTPTQEGGEA